MIMNAPISPNWYVIPSVYNGRTSSLRVSGTPVVRPNGVFASNPSSEPKFQPTRLFDFELEVGVFLSRPFPPGEILDISNTPDYIFGLVILNDWSARDIQGYEMPPLGPFHGKGTATTISPWIVTTEALEGCLAGSAKVQSPAPLTHLAWKGKKEEETWDVELEARVVSMFAFHILSERVNG
jgi:fumarylacetoacetase